jgi:hypothetical protein
LDQSDRPRLPAEAVDGLVWHGLQTDTFDLATDLRAGTA